VRGYTETDVDTRHDLYGCPRLGGLYQEAITTGAWEQDNADPLVNVRVQVTDQHRGGRCVVVVLALSLTFRGKF